MCRSRSAKRGSERSGLFRVGCFRIKMSGSGVRPTASGNPGGSPMVLGNSCQSPAFESPDLHAVRWGDVELLSRLHAEFGIPSVQIPNDIRAKLGRRMFIAQHLLPLQWSTSCALFFVMEVDTVLTPGVFILEQFESPAMPRMEGMNYLECLRHKVGWRCSCQRRPRRAAKALSKRLTSPRAGR
jgi:hypothetical protein